jgi:hypothetical protein
MLVTVEIPDEVVAAVQARGETPESYVRALVDEAVRSAPGHAAVAPKKRDIQAFLRAMAKNSDKIPQLPDEAFTRESFYRNHD